MPDGDDLVVEQLAGGQVADPDGVALVAGVVAGVGEPVAVGADVERAEREEVVPLGQLVPVQEDLLAGQWLAVGRQRRYVATIAGRGTGTRHWMPYCLPSSVRV